MLTWLGDILQRTLLVVLSMRLQWYHVLDRNMPIPSHDVASLLVHAQVLQQHAATVVATLELALQKS
jgi:hypothetical protein